MQEKQAILNEKIALSNPKPKAIKKTVTQVYNEYCEFGRAGKAFATIKKQDSLWNNHIKAKFGKRYIDDISVAEILSCRTVNAVPEWCNQISLFKNQKCQT